MTPAQLIAARDGEGNAAAAAVALWAAVTARVAEAQAAAALDMIGQHVGGETDVADAVLRAAVVRLAMYLVNTEALGGLVEVDEVKVQSEFHGAALRRSGVMGLVLPWTAKRAGAI